jgi:hypothetical protein
MGTQAERRAKTAVCISAGMMGKFYSHEVSRYE